MTPRSSPPFRADHVGSLLRPHRLLQARAAHRAGEIPDEALRGVEDEAIRDVVALQEDVGLQTRTDGEFRRTSWHMDFIYRLRGISQTSDAIEVHFRNEQGDLDFTSAALVVDGKVGLDAPIFGEDFSFLKSVTGSGTPKLTIPAPSMVHYRGGRAALDPARLPRRGRVLGRPVGGLRQAGARYLRAWVHLSPARRHQPGLPQ